MAATDYPDQKHGGGKGKPMAKKAGKPKPPMVKAKGKKGAY